MKLAKVVDNIIRIGHGFISILVISAGVGMTIYDMPDGGALVATAIFVGYGIIVGVSVVYWTRRGRMASRIMAGIMSLLYSLLYCLMGGFDDAPTYWPYILLNDIVIFQGIVMGAIWKETNMNIPAQQVDAAEASTIAVPPSDPSGSPR